MKTFKLSMFCCFHSYSSNRPDQRSYVTIGGLALRLAQILRCEGRHRFVWKWETVVVVLCVVRSFMLKVNRLLSISGSVADNMETTQMGGTPSVCNLLFTRFVPKCVGTVGICLAVRAHQKRMSRKKVRYL